MAKDFFEGKGIKYEELDVAKDLKARQEMFDKSHQMGVPVIEVDNEIFVGFNRIELENFLGKAK
jgi:glutaredoxin